MNNTIIYLPRHSIQIRLRIINTFIYHIPVFFTINDVCAEKFCDRYRTRVGGLGFLLGGEVGEGEEEGEHY